MELSYVLITAARNEESYIERTIQSVIAQTILPKKWVIVSDGSTDNTDKIVKSYARERGWIEFIRMHDHEDRQFAAKVHAFNAGYEKVRSLDYDIIGNIDADISFGEDFFEYLLEKFQSMPELGVAGTDYIEGDFHSFKDSFINVCHVNGQCQMFRRQCFEDIGGYLPIKEGGIDWVAVTSARMKGWKTYSFQDKTYIHHQPMGRTHGNTLSARIHYGKKDYFCGGHPLWEIFRGFFQMTRKPYIIGGLLLLSGYFWSWITRKERPVSNELMNFYRQEQLQRLKNLLLNRFRINR
jgi:glycosyltransferase involved in cell wall biosynthesis